MVCGGNIQHDMIEAHPSSYVVLHRFIKSLQYFRSLFASVNCSMPPALRYHQTMYTYNFRKLKVKPDFSDKNEEISSNIPQSLSKPVYLHNVKCSPSDLSLLECGFTKYVGYTTDVQEAIVVCQKRKN